MAGPFVLSTHRATVRECQMSPTKQRMLEFIRQAPGQTKSDLVRRSGIPWGTACYNLDLLERAGMIQAMRSSGAVRLFPGELLPRNAQWMVLALESHTREVLQMFRTHRQLTPSEVIQSSGLSRGLVRRAFAALELAKVVEKQGSGRPRFVVVKDTWRAIEQFVDARPELNMQALGAGQVSIAAPA